MYSFARFYELHPQKRTKRLTEDGPLLSAQYGICTFTPRQESMKKNLKKLICLMLEGIAGIATG